MLVVEQATLATPKLSDPLSGMGSNWNLPTKRDSETFCEAQRQILVDFSQRKLLEHWCSLTEHRVLMNRRDNLWRSWGQGGGT